MKKLLSVVLCVLMLAALLPLDLHPAKAEETSGQCGDDLYWEFDESTGTLTIEGSGKMYDYSDFDAAPWDSYRSSITSVVLPHGLTSIGDYAFQFCANMVSVTIPNTVTSIGDSAFQNCLKISSVTLPNAVANVGESAFSMCENMKSVILGNRIQTIKESTFYRCKKMTAIVIPDSVTNIEGWAFCECTNLAQVTIGSDVTSIGQRAFSGCCSIQTIVIPKCVTDIGQFAFANCSSMTSVTISSGISTISYGLFDGCNEIQSIIIPNSVTNIDSYAFRNCRALQSVVFSDFITNIGYGAFYCCESLSNVILPESVIKIEGEAFEGCGMTSIQLGNNVTEIGQKSFYNCSDLTSIVIPDSVERIEQYTFYRCEVLSSVNFSKNLTYIGESAFQGCVALKDIVIPNKVTRIAKNAFVECSKLETVLIGNKVEYIDSSAFRDCVMLNSILIPDSVTSVGENAFRDCSCLTVATLGNGLISISNNMFNGCEALTSITIPKNLKNVGYSAFYGCTALTDVYYLGTEEERNSNLNINNTGNDPLLNATWHYNVGPAEPHVVFGDEERYFRFYPGEEIEDLVRSEASTVYNPRLAHFLGVMSLAAYHNRVCLGDYRELGFDNPQSYHYSDDDPIAGYIIGIKEIEDGSRFVMVTVRGTQGKSEWLDTNFNVSEHSLTGSIIHNWHDGFTACANAIINDLKILFEGAIPTENITYVITGHSLGAATGNLLSVQLLQNGVNNTDIYDYNFACPNVVFADALDETMHSETYNCIRNICNTEDIVPCVPGELTEKIFNDDISFLMNSGYRWKKYGHTNWFMVTTFTRKGAHKMELYVDFLSNEYTLGAESTSLGGGGTGAFSGGAMAGRCPIDMMVTDGNGNPIAGTVGGEKNYYGYEEGEKALIFINGDKKLIYVFGVEDYRVQITATGEGTMDYTTAWVDFHEEEDPVVHDWEQVALVEGKTFVNEMPYDVAVEDEYLYVVDEDEQPTYRVNEDGTEKEVSAIDGTVEWNEKDVKFKGATPYVIANSNVQTPCFVVKDKNGQVIDPSCYNYRYRENVKAGTGYVIVTFKGDYAGTGRGWFKIYLPATEHTYVENVSNGIKVTWDPVEGAAGYVIYRRAWSSTTNGWTTFERWNNTTDTTYIDGADANHKVYAGSRYQYGVKAYFARRTDPVSGATIGGNVGDNFNLGEVGPLKTTVRITTRTLNSVTAGTKQMTVKWGASSQFTGYQIQYATNSAFTQNAKAIKITNPKTVSTVIKSLTSGKTYYVRLRSYHEFNGMTYYGGWSNVKSCKVK